MSIEEEATGCYGANSYKVYAQNRGYKHIGVVDWCSSAGDWTFIVSKDGEEWYLLWQANNYPRSGFSHSIDLEHPYYGTMHDVLKEIFAEVG